MKFNKKILICALLVLMIIFCVNAVNAAEPLNDTLETSDAGVIALDEGSDDALSASGDTLIVDANGGGDYTSISAAAGAATGGETIFVKNGEYTEATMSGMSKQLTFTGESQEGVIVRTTGTTGFFTTTESGYTSITFNNITFKDVHTTGSTAVINIGGNGDVYINDCTFDNCDGRYGALRIFTSGTATVDNCKFLDTKSSTGSYSSAIDFGGSGSSVYTLKNSIIDGSEIASTTYIFGAIYIEKTAGTVVLDNVTISNCNLPNSNAIIAAKGNTEIKRSKIVNNTVMRDFAYSSLIFIPTGNKLVTVESSLIADNSEPNYLVSSNSASSSFDLNYNNIRDNTFKEGIHHATGSYTLDANWWGSNELPSGVTASTWVVEDNGEYKLNTGEALAKDIPELTGGDEPGPQPSAYDVYVSPDGDDANDGSSAENAVRTIDHAYEIAPEGGVIYLLNGTYMTESEDDDFGRGLTIAKSVSFIGEDVNGVLFNLGNGATIFVRDEVDLAFEHITFVDAVEQKVIHVRSPVHELNVTNCIFKDLQNNEGVICFDDEGGKLNIIGNYFEAQRAAIEMYGACEIQAHNNIFFCDDYPVADYVGASTGNIDYNYYGTNDSPRVAFIPPTYWVIATTTADPTGDVETGDEVTVTVDFNHYTDGTTVTEQSDLIPDFLTVDFSAEGTLSDESVLINNGVATTTYTSDVARSDKVRAKLGYIEVGSVDITVIEPYKGIIYVNKTGDDSNVGSIDAPVATVGKAVELALAEGGSGQIIIDEGTYTGYDYHVTGDLTVTGNGKVTLDANNEGRLFYMSYGDAASKLELSNLILTNAKGYGAAVYSFANELILDNVTIVNNKATGYLIKSNGKLTIKDSNITNSMSGDVIQQSGNGDILITNTVFENNSVVDTTSVFSVIYLSSGSGDLVIEDSKFINNTARQGVIKGNANYNIKVKGTEFINNTDTVSYGGAIYAYGPTLDVSDSTFINNNAYRDGGAIYVGWKTDATVDKSIFINNTAGTTYEGDAIYNGNKLSVGNSVLLTNAAHHLIYNDGEDNVVNAQNNWWGTNDDPKDLVASGYYEDDYDDEYPCGEVDVSNWVTMDASFTPADAQAGDEVTVTATFSNANLPDGIEVTFGSTSGLNTVVSTVAGQASTTYTIDANDEAITATSTNAVIVMPIANPFETNIVTNDTFYNFFDEDGLLKDEVPFDELIFQGEFSDLTADYVIITKPITITGDEAVLYNMGILVASSDVSIDGLTLIATTSLGDLVNVGESNVNLTNLDITYIVGDEDARAISIADAIDVIVNNSKIDFESHVTDSAKDACAINIDQSQNVVVTGSEINSSLPALYVNYEAATTQFMGLDKVNPIRIVGSDNVEITENVINSLTNDYSQEYATIQAIAVLETNDCLIDSNNITLIDEFAQKDQDIYLYGITFAYDEGLVMSNNNFTIHTEGGKEAAGTAYAIQGIESELSIIGNNITTFSNGPNLGIYVTSMMGETSTMLIENNFINVTGLAAAGNNWALVSGIEIQNGDAKVYNNTIYTYNVDEYDENDFLSGISYIQWMYGGRTFDIQDNTVYTEGKYAVYLLDASNSIITGNTLYAHELTGNDAVYIESGENNIVEDNLPEELTNIVTNDTFYKFFDESGFLKDTVPFDELIFQGEFSDLAAGYIIIDQAISIISDNAVLNDLGIVVAASDVKIDGLTLIANGSLGDLINVGEYSDIDLTNLNISYIVGDEEANAINVVGGSNVNILNNTIYFESHVTEDESQTTAINIDSESTEILIENNTIVANFPALLAETYDWSYFGMGLTVVNPVRIYEAETVEIRKNNIDVSINYLYRTTPTVQALYVAGSTDVIIDGNNITVNDEFTPEGTDVYIYAVEIYFDSEVVFTNNNVNISTKGGKDGAGAAYPVNLIASEVEIRNNTLTTVSNGPNLGIYSPYGFGAAKEYIIEDNIINVTGFVGKKNDYALLSAIELQTGYATIYNNTIYVQNKGDYNDDYYVTGISAIQYSASTLTFDVKDNEIYTNGKYTVDILYPPREATVIGNTLYANELKGDESVYIKSGDNNDVHDNLPVKELANVTITADPIWTGSNGIVTVSVPNATGTVTIEVNGKSYDVELEDGVATKEIPAEDLVNGENIINATYNGPEFASNSNTAVLFVADGVVTQDTYMYYFNQDDEGKLFDYISEGATLDFQGSIINPDTTNIVQMNVNKPVNIVSTTGDAYVDLNTTAGSLLGESPGNSFAVTNGGSGSNVTGIYFHNTQVWIANTHNVVLDNISVVVEDQRVGSGVGATTIRENSTNVILKNSYLYTRNNGGSTTFTMSWATNCTIDNCTVKAEGNVGNLIYLNTFNVPGAPSGVPLNNYNVVSNNRIYGKEGSGISVGLMVEGANNLIVNNTLYKSSISTSFGSVNPANNTYVGNTMTEGSGLTAQANSIVYGNNVTGALSTGANSVVYNNTVGGKMTVGAGATAYDNTVGKGLGTGGANAIIENNTIVGAVTINKVGTTFVGNNVTGTVTVSANDNVIKENSINTTGAYAVDLGSKTGNNVTENYLIASELQGDAAVKFTNANNIVENNYPADSNVSVSVEDAVYGEDVVVNVEFNPITSGTIVVSVDGIDYPVEIVSEGKGSVVIPGLAAKDYDVTVTFTGDAPYSIDSENNASFTVFKANATIEATADSVKVGDDVIVNVTFDKDDVTGTVSINVDGTDYTGTVENGTATIVIPDLAADEYTLDVVYSGDDNYNDTAADVSFDVEKYTLDFTKAKGHPGRVDKNATVDVILSESDATGTVSIIVNGTEYSAELVDGAAVIYAPLLPAGVYNFDVIYSGDDKYENNSAPITFNVNKYYPTMKATAESVRVDENANVIVSLPEDATGTVTITVDGVDYTADVIDGTATVELPVISEAGSQKFVVTYSGDDKYRPQTTNVEFNVLKYNANIKATARTVKLGNNVTVNVVLPEDATGEVSITINDTSYTGVAENGAATIIIPDLGVGQYALTVDYSGDDNYKPTNTTVTFNVNKQTTSMKATARTVKVGADVTVNVALASDATGEVVMEVNGVNYTATVEDGAATIVIPDLPYGQYAFDVVYSGDDKYKTRTATVTFNVNKQTTTMKATAKTVKVGDDVTVNVALASDVTGDVIITVDGVDYTATVEDGIATIVIPDLPAGQYALDVKYSGDDKYKNQSTTVKFNVNKYNVKMKATAKYYADGDYSIVSVTLSDDATGSVSVEVNGNNYTVNVVDGSALVAISKLPAGEYPLDVVYSGDAKYKDYTATTTLKVEK